MSNLQRPSAFEDGDTGVGKTPPKRERWPSWARILVVLVAVVGIFFGFAQCTEYQARLVPHLPSGAKQVLARPATDAGVVGTSRTNRDITVVQKEGRIPADLIPVRWSTGMLRPASRNLLITWGYGNCGAPDRETDVFLRETPDSVLIDVWDDTRKDLPLGTACAGVGLTGTATVHLAEPLGSRTLELHEIAPR